MKPAPFSYARPRGLAEALALLAAGNGEAKLLAGGQSLVPMLNMRLLRPPLLIDLNGLAELGGIAPAADGGLRIGALARHADLVGSPLVRERAPLLAEAARHVGHPAIRNRGTLGGSLAHADPAAELPAALLALDAELTVSGAGGSRAIPVSRFFRGLLATALEPDEILTEIRVPAQGPGWGFAELARRPGDFALAGVAAVVRAAVSEASRCESARVVGFGVGDRPARLDHSERVLAGASLDGESAARAGRAAAEGCEPPGDVHASSEYRRHLATVLAEAALLQAVQRLELPDRGR
jgi:CO/xanthine dehydrogenase FAD-binding subunit